MTFWWGYWILWHFDGDIGYFKILDGYMGNFPFGKHLHQSSSWIDLEKKIFWDEKIISQFSSFKSLPIDNKLVVQFFTCMTSLISLEYLLFKFPKFCTFYLSYFIIILFIFVWTHINSFVWYYIFFLVWVWA